MIASGYTYRYAASLIRAPIRRAKVSDATMDALNIEGDAFHPEWNYTIAPRVPP